jgi:hypothetical protein
MVSKNFAHGNVVPAIGVLCSKLQDQQLIERPLILPTPANETLNLEDVMRKC